MQRNAAVPQEPPSRDGPAQAHSTRGRLLAATYDLLVENGYHATTVQNVVQRSGLSSGAIYANFANKQEMMALAVLDRLGNIGTQLPLAMPPGCHSEMDRLMAMMAHHLTTPAAPEHRLLTEVTGAVIREDGLESPLLAGVQLIEAVARDAVGRAQADKVIDERLSADALVIVLLSVYLGSITTKAWGFPQPRMDEVLEVLGALRKGLARAD